VISFEHGNTATSGHLTLWIPALRVILGSRVDEPYTRSGLLLYVAPEEETFDVGLQTGYPVTTLPRPFPHFPPFPPLLTPSFMNFNCNFIH
jgi:hypothetical protein